MGHCGSRKGSFSCDGLESVAKRKQTIPLQAAVKIGIWRWWWTNRTCFVRNRCHQLKDDSRYLRYIVSSGECKFSITWAVRKQNCHVLSSKRKILTYQSPHKISSIIFFGVLSENTIIEIIFSIRKHYWSLAEKDSALFILSWDSQTALYCHFQHDSSPLRYER